MTSNSKKPLLIWTYHRVLPQNGNAAVTCKTFIEQIEYLKKKHYHFITTKELLDWFSGKLDYSKKYTVLTFDDGWADNYFWAQPILEKYGIKAVLAVNTGLINKESEILRTENDYKITDSKKSLYNSVYDINKASFLSKAEIIAMENSGVWDIQAHGNSHFGTYSNLKKIRGFAPDFSHWTMQYALEEPVFDGAPRAEFKSILANPKTTLNKELIKALKLTADNKERLEICRNFNNPIMHSESRKEFLKRLVTDMLACRNWLSDTIKKDCYSMVWPWGHYSQDSINIAKELQFNLLFTMNKAGVTGNSSQFEIPRIAVPTTLKRFIHQEKVFSSPLKTAIRNIFNKKK